MLFFPFICNNYVHKGEHQKMFSSNGNFLFGSAWHQLSNTLTLSLSYSSKLLPTNKTPPVTNWHNLLQSQSTKAPHCTQPRHITSQPCFQAWFFFAQSCDKSVGVTTYSNVYYFDTLRQTTTTTTTILQFVHIREGSRYQSGWIFGKIPNCNCMQLWSFDNMWMSPSKYQIQYEPNNELYTFIELCMWQMQ